MASTSPTCSFLSLPSTSTNHSYTRHSLQSNVVSFGRPLRFISAAYTATVTDRTVHQTSFYEVLGIQDGATRKEIKAAYRRLARAVHPDVAAVSSNGDEFIRVNQAYVTLSDPSMRADYDMTLSVKRSSMMDQTTSYSRFSGYASRSHSWETDQCW